MTAKQDPSPAEPGRYNLFEELKEVPVHEIFEEVLGIDLKKVGASSTTDDDECPFCGHRGCFRINNEENFFHCFSCEAGGDGVSAVSQLQDLPPYAAAMKIAEAFGVPTGDSRPWEDLPSAPVRRGKPAKAAAALPYETLSPEELDRRERILADIVRRCVGALWDTESAVQYQREKRGHKEDVLRRYGVGLMPANLVTDLVRDQVCNLEDLKALGMVNERCQTLIAPGCYTYPLYNGEGRLCGIAGKDPNGLMNGQQRKDGHLGAVPFFGMQVLKDAGVGREVWVVEGQNDALSIADSGHPVVPLATLGSLKTEQLAWMAANCDKYRICTFFDNDDAGDGYRQRVSDSLGGKVEQFIPPVLKSDPDDFICQGGDLSELVSSQRETGTTNASVLVDQQPDIAREETLRNLRVLAAVPVGDGDISDVGVARSFAVLGGGRYVYVRESDCWSYFDRVWEHNRTDAAFREVVAMGDSLLHAARISRDSDEGKALVKAGKSLHSVKKINAVLTAAANDARVAVSAADFDANEKLLGLQNGVIDLKTLSFRPAIPGDMISKSCNVVYDPKADCPQFKAFLNEALRFEDKADSEAMFRYIHWGIGQLLLWKPGRRWIAHLYGPPGSGKSTLIETLQYVLGDYAKAVDPKAFSYSSKAVTGPSPEVAKLVGVRFVTVPEAGDENTLNDEQLKALSGGDTISARYLHKNPIEFRFGGMIWFVGNTRPSSKTNGAAFFRRFRIIPMPNSRPEHEQDRNLEPRLREEASGILNFMLDGLKAYGLKEPALPRPMAREMEIYKEEMDVIGLWIDESCRLKPEYSCSTTSLYENYAAFVRAIGSFPLGRNKFQARLVERGFSKTRKGNVAHLVGIDINPCAAFNNRY